MKILVSRQDYDRVSKYTWHISWNKDRTRKYARARINGKLVLMHRFILEVDSSFDVDHRNRNGLDNTRRNLRVANRSQNNANGLGKGNKNGFKGTFFNSDGRPKPWYAQVGYEYRTVHCGSYVTPEEAARAYDRKAVELFGEFALTNQMLGLFA